MARDTIIAERPVPPKGRLSFPMLILRMIANPVASWGEDFYEEPAVLYRWLGLQTLYVMDPILIQRIDRDMAGTTLQALQDTVLGAGLGDDNRRVIQEAGATFLFYSMWKVVLTSLRLPPTIPHPGAQKMARAGKRLRETAEKVLVKRNGGSEGGDLLGRFVTARDPAAGSTMPPRLIVDLDLDSLPARPVSGMARALARGSAPRQPQR